MKQNIKTALVFTLFLSFIFGVGLVIIRLNQSEISNVTNPSSINPPEIAVDDPVISDVVVSISATIQSTDPAEVADLSTKLLTITAIPLTPSPIVTPTPIATLPYDYLYPPVYEESYQPVPLIPQPEKQINILVLGSDQFGDRQGYRTDAIMLVTINTEDDTVNITSFPRDLYVYIPGWTVQRINTAYPYGGFELLADTLEYNFGVRPDYYAFIHVSFLEEVVDDLGGITVHVEKTLCANRSDYNGVYCLFPGDRYMDGATAFWYAKSRHTIDNDFGRNRRHQELLRGIFNRALEMRALTKIPKLYGTYKDNVDTNMNIGTILKLVPTATKLIDQSRITQYFISQSEIINWTTDGGGQVLIPQPKLVRDILLQALNSPNP